MYDGGYGEGGRSKPDRRAGGALELDRLHSGESVVLVSVSGPLFRGLIIPNSRESVLLGDAHKPILMRIGPLYSETTEPICSQLGAPREERGRRTYRKRAGARRTG